MSIAAYGDILFLPRPISEKRRHMTALERAAQFAPFAALSGYDAAIAEEARLTDRESELGDWERAELDEKLRLLLERAAERPEITVTYFLPDGKKAGGRYETVRGRLKKLKLFERELMLADGTVLSLEQVKAVSSPLFDAMEF